MRAPAARMLAAQPPAQPPAAQPGGAKAQLGIVARWGAALIGLYIIGKMFYVFKSGNAQPADLALPLIALVTVPLPRLFRLLRDEWPITMLFLWITMVSVGWAIASDSRDYLVAVSFYAFNLLALVAVISARDADPERFDRILPRFIIAAVVIQIVAIFVDSGGGMRSTGTFRNPNQLAYWCVCTTALWIFTRGCRLKPLDVAVLLGLTICQFASISRAGMGASLIALALWGYFALGTPVRRLGGGLAGLLLILMLALTPAMTSYLRESEQFSKVQERLAKRDQYASVSGRTFDRVLEHPEKAVLGAGEGEYERFADAGEQALEVHSTFGTMLFSYGVIGFALFLAMVASLMFRVRPELWVHLVPIFVYSTTHQGLRLPLFWMAIGILVSYAHMARRSPAAAVAPPHDAAVAAPPPQVRPPAFQRRDSAYLKGLGGSR